MICNKCGKEATFGAVFCDNCGSRLDYSSQSTFQQTEAEQKTSIMAIVGFILGCVSLLINFWGIVGIVALIFSIVGITQINNNGEKGKGFAICGIILGAAGIVWGVIALLSLNPLV